MPARGDAGLILYSYRPCAVPVPQEPQLDRMPSRLDPVPKYESEVTDMKVKRN